MLFKNKKGQGALEYLLLIGGAVLIAVIVIALLVGMGGQSRDTASQQADRAQQASDIPQPAQIVSVTAEYSECTDKTDDANLSFSWRALGEGGAYKLYIVDSAGNGLDYDSPANTTHTSTDPLVLDPSTSTDVGIFNVDLATNDGLCGDTYYIYITTTKNDQTVSSSRRGFGWYN